MQEIEETNRQKDMQDGFAAFKTEYADIAADPALFAVADSKSDVIAAEHRDWSPSKVMLEAGKQTRDWLKSLGNPAGTGAQPSNRQQRKESLKPMPQARSGKLPRRSKEEQPSSPKDLLADIRKARGQGT